MFFIYLFVINMPGKSVYIKYMFCIYVIILLPTLDGCKTIFGTVIELVMSTTQNMEKIKVD